MPKRKYNDRQEAAITLLSHIHLERVNKKATIRLRIEAALRDELNDIELRESRAANEALALGVSKTDIGRTVGTANFTTITDMLARTAGQETAEDLYIDPLDSRYSFDVEANTLTVTLTGETLAYMLDQWEEDLDERGAIAIGANVETFTIKDDGTGRPRFAPNGAVMVDGRWNLAIKWLDVNANAAEAREYVEGKGWVA